MSLFFTPGAHWAKFLPRAIDWSHPDCQQYIHRQATWRNQEAGSRWRVRQQHCMHPTFENLSNSFFFCFGHFTLNLICSHPADGWKLEVEVESHPLRFSSRNVEGIFSTLVPSCQSWIMAVMPIFWGLALVLICAQMVHMQAKSGIIGNHRCMECMDGMLAVSRSRISLTSLGVLFCC